MTYFFSLNLKSQENGRLAVDKNHDLIEQNGDEIRIQGTRLT